MSKTPKKKLSRSKFKLDDPYTRGLLLGALRGGASLYAACDAAGVHPATLRAYRKDPANDDINDEIDEAYNESVEPVLEIVRESALEGDMTAAKLYLTHKAGPPRSEREKNAASQVNIHIDTTGQLEGIASLQDRLLRRAEIAELTAVQDYDEGDEDEST